MTLGRDKMGLKHTWNDDELCRIANPAVPEAAVAQLQASKMNAVGADDLFKRLAA